MRRSMRSPTLATALALAASLAGWVAYPLPYADLIEDARLLDDRGDRFAAEVEEEDSIDWDELPVLK